MTAVAVFGTTAVVGHPGHLDILDVTDATSPRGISELEIHPSVRAIKVVGPRAFVLGYDSACRGCADHDAMLTIVDVSRPKTPSVLSDYRLRDAAGNLGGFAVSGDELYIADSRIGMRIVNVSNPATPIELGAFSTPGSASGVAVSGTTAYVADGTSLRIVDVANPAFPREVGAYIAPAFAVAVMNSVAFVVDPSTGVHAVDVSDSTRPRSIGFLEPRNSPLGDITISGSFAYLIGTSISAVDVSSPSAFRDVGTLYASPSGSPAKGIAISGHYAFIAAGSEGLVVRDVSKLERSRAVDAPAGTSSSSSVNCAANIALADADGSGRVDGVDLYMMGRAFASVCGETRFDKSVDFNADCRIDGSDLAYLAAEFGKQTSWFNEFGASCGYLRAGCDFKFPNQSYKAMWTEDCGYSTSQIPVGADVFSTDLGQEVAGFGYWGTNGVFYDYNTGRAID